MGHFKVIQKFDSLVGGRKYLARNLVTNAWFINQIGREPGAANDQWVEFDSPVCADKSRATHAGIKIRIAPLKGAIDKNIVHQFAFINLLINLSELDRSGPVIHGAGG
jgi:hypothetical protein